MCQLNTACHTAIIITQPLIKKISISLSLYTLLGKFWRISLYVTYDAIAKLYCDVYFSQIVGNDGKISSHTAKQLRHQLDFPTVYLSVAGGCHVSKALDSSLTWRNTSWILWDVSTVCEIHVRGEEQKLGCCDQLVQRAQLVFLRNFRTKSASSMNL